MLLKRPETSSNSSLRNKNIIRTTLIICALIFLFFIARLSHLYQKAKNFSVTVGSLVGESFNDSNLSTTENAGVIIDTGNLHSSNPVSYPQTLPDLGHQIGIAVGSQLTGLNDAELEKEISGMQALGVKWARFDIEWGFVQYDSKNKYDWSRYDRIINSLSSHGINGVGILTYTPEWARTSGCGGGAHCPPNNPSEFATFAAAAVNRYKAKGMHYWEIWNEENDYDFWATKSDCQAYTALLKATYPAVKKADPTAFVITGGLAQVSNTDVNIAPLDFVQCIYTEGGKNYFDAIGYHPYTFPQLPSSSKDNGWAKMSLTSPSIRSIMIANGDSAKKIWLTEFGTPTSGPDPVWYVSEDKQSQMIADAVTLDKNSEWAGPLFWYTYKDGGTTKDTNENFFGLVRNDYSQKPAYQTMKSILTEN